MTNRSLHATHYKKKMMTIFTLVPSQSFSNLLFGMRISTRNFPENLEGQNLKGQPFQSISLSLWGRQMRPSGMHKVLELTYRNWRLFIPWKALLLIWIFLLFEVSNFTPRTFPVP